MEKLKTNTTRFAKFRRCQEWGIKLNRDKFVLKLNETSVMGHQIGTFGVQSDPDKVKAVLEMK
jgi:hypothetical protein